MNPASVSIFSKAVIVHDQSLGFQALPAQVFRTPKGTPYLKEAGVAVLSAPQTCLEMLGLFLFDFDSDLGYQQFDLNPGSEYSPAALLCKSAGQLCYMAFGAGSTPHSEMVRYFDNIRQQKHGSVLEHANFSLLLYGISRSLTHELVRHRAGMAFSQVSQRYVDGKVLRFVMRPEYDTDEPLRLNFFERIDRASAEYESVAQRLIRLQGEGSTLLSGDKKRELRKKVNQAARSLLPNETEAPIVVTGNVRAWRHVLEMRASEHAEVEIRRAAMKIYYCLKAMEPSLFSDYDVVTLPDGTQAVDTKFRKV